MKKSSCPFERKRERLANGGKPRLLDICGGAGGFSLGFMKAGFDLVGSVESDPVAAATYAANLHAHESQERRELLAMSRDLLKMTPGKLVKELDLGPVDGAADVILAGLPCQAFARIGRPKLGHLADDPTAYRTDPRAGLYRRFLRYVRAMKPLCVVIENVPDILNHGGHNVPEEISRALGKCGYACRYTLLNAASYGVPQLRERLFLIAYHQSLDVIPEFPAATHRAKFPPGYTGVRFFALKHVDKKKSHYVASPPQTGALPAITIKKAISDLATISRKSWSRKDAKPARKMEELSSYRDSASTYALAMRHWKGFATNGKVSGHIVRHTPRDYAHFAAMKHGEQYPEMYRRALKRFHALLKRRRNAGKAMRRNSKAWSEAKASIVPPYDPEKFPNKWRKLEPDKPSCTLTAHLGKDSYSHIHYDSRQARTISVREAARLQSFPDGFVFQGAMNAAFRQVGNAVPPLLAFAIAKEVVAALAGAQCAAFAAYRVAAE